MLVIGRGRGEDAIEAIILLQFILYEFPNRLQHQPIYEATRPLFDSVVDDEKNLKARK